MGAKKDAFYADRLIAFIASIVFALFTVTGMWSIQEFDWKVDTIILCFSCVIYCIIYYFVSILVLYWRRVIRKQRSTVDTIDEPMIKYGMKWFVFCGFLIIYFPVFLAVYPGIFGYDGPVQVYQVFSEVQSVTAQHPLIHTYLLAGCFKIGKVILGDYNSGLAIYSLLQVTFMAGVFTYTIGWLYKRKVSLYLCICTFVFLAFNPVIVLLNFNTTKDTMFGGFFLLMFIQLIELMEKPWLFRLKKCNLKRIVVFLTIAIFMCLFRKQGYYLLLFVGIVSIVLFGKKNKIIPIIILFSALFGFVLMELVISVLGVPKGDSKEMLSVPMQQLANVWDANDCGNIRLKDEEVRKIEELIPVDYLKLYYPRHADYVKTGFNTEVLKRDMKGYIKLYFSLGYQYPELYFRAFIQLISGYWDFEQFGELRGLLYINTFSDASFSSNLNICNIERNSKLPELEKWLCYLTENIENFPIIRIIFSHVLPVWIMFFVIITCGVEKNKALFGSMLLLFGQWCIMLLSPAMLIRYAQPLIVCLPIMVTEFFKEADKNTNNEVVRK